jgi:uncharacterized protein (UPF0248 family)
MPGGKARQNEIVDEHLHRDGFSAECPEVDVADRVAEGGVRTIHGAEIVGASGGFLGLRNGGCVPLHRALVVRSRGAIVCEPPS